MAVDLEKYRRKYGTVVIPDLFNRRKYDRKVEVVPVTDSWLVDSGRSWEEIDSILEGRLLMLQAAFQDPHRSVIRIAQSYGIERPASGNMARFLAYVELVDQYRLEHERFDARAEAGRAEYEERKHQIKNGPGGRGGKENKIINLWRTQYHPNIQEWVRRTGVARAAQNLILRKAVIDFFSANSEYPEVVDALPKLLDDARGGIENSTAAGLRDRRPVDYFIGSLSEYLQSTNEKSLFTRYSYKASESLVKLRKDLVVLDTCLKFALDPAFSTDRTRRQLQVFGEAYFNFLKRLTVWKASVGIGERYPLLSLLYTTHLAALKTGERDILKALPNLVDPYLADIFASPLGRNEVERCITQWAINAEPVYLYLERHREAIVDLKTKRPRSPGEWPAEVLDFVAGDESNLLMYVVVLERLRRSDSKSIKVSDALPRGASLALLYDQIMSNKGFSLPVVESNARDNIERLLFALQSREVNMLKGIEVSVLPYICDAFLMGREIKRLRVDRPEFREFISEVVTKCRALNFDPDISDTYILNSYFRYIESKYQSSELSERENRFLWNEILNNLKWFVSPRGDRFRSSRDSQLADLHVATLTFRIDRDHPREHLFELQIEGTDYNFQFWLDTHKELLNSHRGPVIVEPGNMQTLLNIVLKRLYVITSGALSRGEEHVSVGAEGQSLIYKRAHYRYLTSTDTRPITMESSGAHVHAQEILEDYGIDIYGEIRRRRNIGTLRQSEYLTFVRESTLGIRGQLVLPNELTYKPELVRIPV